MKTLSFLVDKDIQGKGFLLVSDNILAVVLKSMRALMFAISSHEKDFGSMTEEGG